MAERRMFTKKITDGDIFTSMPPTTQCLYFHLCMGADDDGFSNNIRIAMFNAHATVDDFNTLVNKRFIIPFESGVIVIKHWKMHNYIQNDRYHESKFMEEKSQLVLKSNNVYKLKSEMDTTCIQDVSKMDTEVRLDKYSIDKKKTILPKGNIAKEKDFSFDKHTNKENLDYLFEHDEKFSKLKADFKQALSDWCEYKDQRKPKNKHHYTEKGLKMLINQATNKAVSVGTTPVINQINKAIASTWDGMNLDMLDKQENKYGRY